VILGCIEPNDSGVGKHLFNSAALIHGSRVTALSRKCLLPTYDVFDENRYFEPADQGLVVDVNGKRIGLSICEDAWNDEDFWPRRLYRTNPIENLATQNADIIVNISASPYSRGKEELRFRMLAHQAKKYSTPIIHVNQIGGNDELIFAGNSFVIGRDGTLIKQGSAFEEDFLVIDDKKLENGTEVFEEDGIASVFSALKLGVRDYLHKCGFEKVVIGLSGGIDSAVTAAVARFALEADDVLTVTMPSRYSSVGSLRDSRELARNLGIRIIEVAIDRIYQTYLDELTGLFQDSPEGVTEENIQARIRGNILMAISNKFGHLVLSTGNKSELATGYCTLYGDMSGGLAVLSDVPKTMVYELAEHINALNGAIIPESIIKKPPSAELKPNQFDQDSLPPYDVLDSVLTAYIEDNRTREEIIGMGHSPELVDEIVRLVNRNEYKRRQAPPTLKISPQAFGTGWRVPIAQRFNR
jgi:NAD+ synthase (glutamine-hydrolysing)